jgi:hypothetical protein
LICSCQPEKREPSYSSVKRNVCMFINENS